MFQIRPIKFNPVYNQTFPIVMTRSVLSLRLTAIILTGAILLPLILILLLPFTRMR